jgi:hypothetical protein
MARYAVLYRPEFPGTIRRDLHLKNKGRLERGRLVARAHFVVRRLERRYGKDAVRTAYERFCSETKAAA